jgi:uncharacterized protein (DUF2249 family)
MPRITQQQKFAPHRHKTIFGSFDVLDDGNTRNPYQEQGA